MTRATQEYISQHPMFSTAEFTAMLQKETPDIARSTVYSILKKLCDSKTIIRLKKGYFSATPKALYSYELSDTAKAISTTIKEEYPLVDFQIWELYQLNEFVNHQISRNTIFVYVENMLDDSIFQLLFDRYPHVLHNPNADEYYKYAGTETIVVQRLISESPASYGEYNQSPLEKILVDLLGRGLVGSIISRSEYPAIYEDSFSKYGINTSKLLRYARRRNAGDSLLKFIKEETNITLEAPN